MSRVSLWLYFLLMRTVFGIGREGNSTSRHKKNFAALVFLWLVTLAIAGMVQLTG